MRSDENYVLTTVCFRTLYKAGVSMTSLKMPADMHESYLDSEPVLPEVMRESLRYCSRDELERIQPDHGVLNEMIVAGSGVFSLRLLRRLIVVR